MKEESGILSADSLSADAKLVGHGTITDGFEMTKAGVTMGMTAYEAEQRVIAYRNSPPPGGYTSSGNNYGLKAIALFFAVALAIAAVFKVVEWMPPIPSPIEMAHQYFGEKKASNRRERFSDFSRKVQWPARIQAATAQFQDASLESLLVQVPVKVDSMEASKREALAAGIWFALSAHGSNANATYLNIAKNDARVRIHSVPILVVRFLEKNCQAGVEVACLDVAKVYAGAVFMSATGDEGKFLDKRALEYLPTTGPLSNAPAIVELRTRVAKGF